MPALARWLTVSGTVLLLSCGLAAMPAAAQGPQPPLPPDVDAAAPPLEPVPSPAARKPVEKEASHASLFAARGGRRMLLIDYPWARHQNASVEVRLLSGEGPGAATIRPLSFVARHFHGKVRSKIYDVQDAAANSDTAEPLNVDETQFEVVGRRNSLGRQVVYLVRSIPPHESPPGASAVYCELPSWSINRGLLHLDLPGEQFAPAGKLRVWFLRGRDVLWSQTLNWPGMK
jgi:hypothetical protein